MGAGRAVLSGLRRREGFLTTETLRQSTCAKASADEAQHHNLLRGLLQPVRRRQRDLIKLGAPAGRALPTGRGSGLNGFIVRVV